MDKNGFFRFSTKDGATYVSIFPPTGAGKPVTLENIEAYLNLKNFGEYDLKNVSSQLNSVGTEGTFKLSDVAITNYTAFCDYKITPNNMYVMATMYPGVNSATPVSPNEILRDLEAKGIKFGINRQQIATLVSEQAYNTTVVIATGQPPVEGHDARIEYLFNYDLNAKPAIKEDGTVDYKELDLISQVKAGQTVAKMIPEDRGTPGTDVFEKRVEPKRVTKINFKYGKNLYISEDGLSLITKVSGQVTLEGEKVFVSDTYEVPVDVDMSTGNIDFDGNVLVRGTVRSGFKIKATGDVNVYGVVEGAEIEAGGDVMINRGVQGMNKAVIKAGGNVVSKFMESSTVVCQGDLETDSILHSNVSCGGSINVTGRNGLIVGGNVRATVGIDAKEIGNEMGTNTELSVGIDPAVRRRVKELTDALKKEQDDKEKLNQAVTLLRKKKDIEGSLDEAKTEMLQKSMRNIILLEQQIKKDTAELNECQQKASENDKAYIKVLKDIYPGCKLTFGTSAMIIKDKISYCRFVKRGADVVPDII